MPDWVLPLISIVLGAIGGWGTAAVQLGRYTQTVDDLKDKVNRIEEKLSAMSTKITECSTKVDERTKSYASTLTQSNSPITLSPHGESLLKRSGADAFVLNHQKKLVDKIRATKPATAFDVQVAARNVVVSIQNDDNFKPFKNFVYNEGTDLEPIFIVMSLYLRDIALPLLGFKPEDIDKSDPKQTKIPE